MARGAKSYLQQPVIQQKMEEPQTAVLPLFGLISVHMMRMLTTCHHYISVLVQWLLDHEIDTLDLDLTFSVETESFGRTSESELKPDGARITVTDKNKVYCN